MFCNLPETAPVLQLRISLRGVNPPIWRLLLVPARVTLVELHRVMQRAMDVPLQRVNHGRLNQRSIHLSQLRYYGRAAQ
ncbi:hypothetical protein [Burkholderia sp. Ac-20353]|uniref:IS1096 element passenger TnpR family protein n=1 Tax=Burkholderia sp. Ac-20353 TaxID=2703894 RepID=UPI00197C2D97|nr:hypothetical protein [Burkholderia sp. Ac-20353]MBN3785595.1 plasmid pRiA4b ORF-3 family protein [Burkholderia sp. Ac-20353]